MKNHYDKCFENTYLKYRNKLISFTITFTRNLQDAEDIVNDLFARLYSKKTALDPDRKNIQGFLFTSAKNLAIDISRRGKRYNSLVTENIEKLSMDDSFYNDLEGAFIQGEVINTLHDTIEPLDNESKKIFLQGMLNDKGRLSSISRELSISAYRIKKTIYKVKTLIKDKMGHYFIE